MNVGRSSKIAEALKNVESLGKTLKVPAVATNVAGVSSAAAATSQAIQQVKTSGFVSILMYVIAGILLIGILLLGIDQWITPVFQRSPGGDGYIPIPGTDMSQVIWPNLQSVTNITIGSAPTPIVAPGAPVPISPPNITVIEGQSTYGLTMDVFIQNEFPQNLPTGYNQRVLFLMGATVDSPILRVGLDNSKNTIYVTIFDSAGKQQSVVLDNVPIRLPFRIGVVVAPFSMEGYLNGELVMTKKLNDPPISPAKGSVIFQTSNIVGVNTDGTSSSPIVLSTNIKVLNVRAFGYAVPPTEMMGRMNDLKEKAEFQPTTDSPLATCSSS